MPYLKFQIGQLVPFCMTDGDWPEYLRIHPILVRS